MGLQITVLLADVIYVDILQSTVPVFDSFGSSPLILRLVLKSVPWRYVFSKNLIQKFRLRLKTQKSFFIVSIVLLCVCLMVSTYTLFIYHCAIYECKNFSRTEAIISRAIAIMFTKCACGWWEIEVPENTEKIAEHEGSFLIFRQSTIVHYPWFTDHESWRPDMDTLGSFRMVKVLNFRNSRSLNFFWKLKKMTGHFTKNSVLTNYSWDSSFMLTCWAD